jgi:hypothetical protein
MLSLTQDGIDLFSGVMQPALGKIFGIIHMLLGFEYRSLSARIDLVNLERLRFTFTGASCPSFPAGERSVESSGEGALSVSPSGRKKPRGRNDTASDCSLPLGKTRDAKRRP